MPTAAYYDGYPSNLITDDLIDEIQKLDHFQGYDAGLARFRAVVGDHPWFQNPATNEFGSPRLESEYLLLVAGENEVSVGAEVAA